MEVALNNIFSPSIILGIYSQHLKTSADSKIIFLKGVYLKSSVLKDYGGYYYDRIKNEESVSYLIVKTPAKLRTSLDTESIYTFKGFIEKKLKDSSVELQFVISEIIGKEESKISEDDLLRYEIVKEKLDNGVKDVELLVKNSVYNNKTLRIANLYGNTSVVNKDFIEGIGEAAATFEIKSYKCNLHSHTEIIRALKIIDAENYNIIAVVRGGGNDSDFDIYNNPEIAQNILKCKAHIVTAMGHVVHDTLMDKVADRKFALPLDYGKKLQEWVNEANEQMTKSKSVLIDQVKKNFTNQILTLEKQLTERNKQFEDSKLESQKNLKIVTDNIEKTVQAKAEAVTEKLRIQLENQKKTYEDKTKELDNQSFRLFIYIGLGIVIGIILSNLFFK